MRTLTSIVLLGLAACQPPDEKPERDGEPVGDTDTTLLTEEPTVPEPTEPTTPTTPEPVEPPAGEWLLETDEVRYLDLVIDAAALESLAFAPDAWVPADLEIGGESVPGVAVRLKGNGSFQPIDQKPSWKIDINHWTEDLELDGLDDLVLNNLVSDPTYVRERLAYELYRELGIPAPRATHVQVRVNAELYGVYLLFEDADARFLSRWFAKEDGPLYEMFDVDFTPAGVWQFDHDGGPDDRTALSGLSGVLADPASRFTVDAENWVDVDAFTKYFGASAVIGQFDAYPYSVPGDDVFVYVDPSDDRIHILPHGGDETFADPLRPVDYAYGLAATSCLADPDCEDLWAASVWSALSTAETLDLGATAASWFDDIDQGVQDDPRTPYTTKETKAEVALLQEFLASRRAGLEAMPGLPPE